MTTRRTTTPLADEVGAFIHALPYPDPRRDMVRALARKVAEVERLAFRVSSSDMDVTPWHCAGCRGTAGCPGVVARSAHIVLPKP